MTKELNTIKEDHYRLTHANKETSEKLGQEREKSVNMQHLKNIISSYFSTTDVTEQSTLQRVVFQAMQFTEEE